MAPFVTYRLSTSEPTAHAPAHGQDAPLVTAMLVGLALIALLIELQGQTLSAKTIAMLGVLVAISSVLRFIEVAVPMPGGFSPIFAPIILAGYVFGARFGFLMGTFTLLTSALITGGVGPWLPYQMFTAGWTGMTAGWLGHAAKPRFGASSRERLAREILVLGGIGFAWGILYGAIINVYFWPFAVAAAEQAYVPGLGLGGVLARYAAFYVTTSLAWDLARAVGNAVLLLLLGAPMVRALARFRRRFDFEVSASA
jgi:energy-coupling factor transport system substrate-specific component